jgi:bacterioferritin-associated ferredoxin
MEEYSNHSSSTLTIVDDAPIEEDAIVCYCYKLTTKDLKDAYRRCGSLKEVEQQTRAGTGCAGCKIILHELFQEQPEDQYNLAKQPTIGTLCSKPGNYSMKGFVIANGTIESRVYASNGVAPQLGDCDSTTPIEYALLDHMGQPVLKEHRMLAKNETFVFDTSKLDLPRPFYGIFNMNLGRSNIGAARFNIYWITPEGVTATHELSATGRARVFLPFLVDKRFLEGPNAVYLAMMNPHDIEVPYNLSVINVDRKEEYKWNSSLKPHCSCWIDTNSKLFARVIKDDKDSRFALRIELDSFDIYKSLSSYFFTHNRSTRLWNCNHL